MSASKLGPPGTLAAIRRVLAVVAREFLDLRHNPRLIVSVYLIPLVFSSAAIPALSRGLGALRQSIGQPHAHAAAHPHREARPHDAAHPAEAVHPGQDAPAAVANRELSEPDGPPGMKVAFAQLHGHPEKIPAFLMAGEFMSFLFMFALFQPLALGAQAIVAEKQEGTLEPLLATPLETGELLAGKTLFAIVPAVGLTWMMYGLQLWSATTVLPANLVMLVFASTTWRLAIFVLVPLLASFATLGLVALSARVSDPRTAQQLGALLVFPMAASVLALVFGLVAFRTLVTAAIGLLAIGCAVLMRLAILTFQREQILTRWR